MRCTKCGHEMDDRGYCSYCGWREEPQVRVMSSEEKHQYDGITIDEDMDSSGRETEVKDEKNSYEQVRFTRPRTDSGQHIFVKNFNLDRFGGNWAMKIALLLLVSAVIAFVVFIALPVALIGIAIGAVVWLLLSFLRG